MSQIPIKYRLPRKLVEEIESVKDSVDPKIYNMLCKLIITIDEANLVNDQICISPPDDAGSTAGFEWPTYGIYFDLMKGQQTNNVSFKIYQPKNKISALLYNIEDAGTLLSSVLEMSIDKSDIYDEYRKDKRTMENTTELYIGI